MCDECEHCGSTSFTYHPAQRQLPDEPGYAAYWECDECGRAYPAEEEN